MTIKDKVFHLNSQFTKELPADPEDAISNILIEGYASVNTPDRVKDVVPSSVWEKGMKNFLKNPIVLAQHKHDLPVGRVIEHRVDNKGLWVKARISSAAKEVFNLVRDEVLTAFSVAFRVLDAEYDAVTELFIVKEVELLELSVVSVPMHQDSLFSLSKSFDNEDEYKQFKLQFAPSSDKAKGLETSSEASGTTLKEIGMDPKELQTLLANTATAAAEAATAKLLKAQQDEAAARKKAADEEAAMQARIKEAVAAVTPTTTGADKLVAELEKRMNEQAEISKKALEDLQSTLAEKSKELADMAKSKMSFADKKSEPVSYAEKETAVMLSKITGKSIESTKFGKLLLEKAGAHVPGAVPWEQEVSFNMENEVRRRLVVASLPRQIAMQTNVMKIPVNPEAGDGTWVTNAQFGTDPSSGTAQTHQLKEITLSAYKVATREYVAYEEEEDSLLVLMPIIRDAMIRRVARAVDKAFLLGAGAGADPVQGFAIYDATSAVTPAVATQATVATLRDLRKDLGYYGLDASGVVYVVSTDIYYDLLDDATFQTMDKVGDKATLLTGQIGTVGNSPVLVSDMFPAKASGTASGTTNIGAIALATENFLAGNQRGLRFDTQDLVETQRKVLVASLRTGMTQISTVNGDGVSTLRWAV